MSIKDFLDSCEDSVEVEGTARFKWSLKGRGFGEVYFFVGKDGKTLEEYNVGDRLVDLLSVGLKEELIFPVIVLTR